LNAPKAKMRKDLRIFVSKKLEGIILDTKSVLMNAEMDMLLLRLEHRKLWLFNSNSKMISNKSFNYFKNLITQVMHLLFLYDQCDLSINIKSESIQTNNKLKLWIF